jgi:pyrimidine-nucleoside phosphorylase
MVACCGVGVPMMSGRGLGHTGGTLDKLESIPGFTTQMPLREAEAQVRRLGCALFGQTAEIAPVDKRMYALRDVTGTVPSIPLIAASIMSKKLAEGLNGLVLDVKTGIGSFLPAEDQALDLARTMIGLGESHGVRTVAFLTAMDRPLGRACGNALEIEECLMALQGQGPADLMAVTYALAVEMLLLAGVETDARAARTKLERVIASGAALEKFAAIIEAQGGNPVVAEDPSLLPQAGEVEVYETPKAGWVRQVEPRVIGHAIVAMGGGRQRVEDAVDPTVGFVITVKPGDRVDAGQPIASIFARDEAGVAVGVAALREAIEVGERVEAPPLVSHRVTKEGVSRL